MKKILIALACATLISAVASISDSCSPTAPNDTAIPITLNSVPGGLTLTRTNISQSASVGLSCGCAFPLSVTGYGGDTALIHFIVWEVPDSSTHTVNASVDPASLPAGPGQDSAWIGLTTKNDSTQSNPGTPLYDTLRAYVAY